MTKINLHYVIPLITVLYMAPAHGQRVLSLSEAEELFKQRNAELLVATQKEIIDAEAHLEEAKKFNNPEFSIDQVNLWSTSNQRGGEKEVIPPIIGNFARNTEFSLGLSQEFRIGGKRRKKIHEEKMNQHVVRFKNQEISNNLILGFKELIFELNYAKEYAGILEKQKQVFDTIITNYKKQKEQGYIAPAELLRMQAEGLQIQQELTEVRKNINSCIKNIQSQLGMSDDEIIDVDVRGSEMILDKGIDYLYTLSLDNPTLLKGQSRIETWQKKLVYEQSLRIPDITLSVNYDRAGSVWNNFIGFGVSFALPVFNRNQAQIKATKRMTRLAEYEHEHEKNRIKNKIRASYENYQQTLNFFNQLTNEPTIANLDKLLEKYKNNIIAKNVSLIEFIDFMETYKHSKNILLETRKELFTQYSMLEATIGLKLN